MSEGRQLHLFKGPRQRGVKPPSPKEFSIHVSIADLLDAWCEDGWIWSHLPFGENRDAITGARLKRMGTKRGWPDFVFFHSSGRSAFLELKRRGGKPNDEQEAVLGFLEAAGHAVAWFDNYDGAVKWLKQVGVLQARLRV